MGMTTLGNRQVQRAASLLRRRKELRRAKAAQEAGSGATEPAQHSSPQDKEAA